MENVRVFAYQFARLLHFFPILSFVTPEVIVRTGVCE